MDDLKIEKEIIIDSIEYEYFISNEVEKYLFHF